jgi:hypothetical protein
MVICKCAQLSVDIKEKRQSDWCNFFKYGVLDRWLTNSQSKNRSGDLSTLAITASQKL